MIYFVEHDESGNIVHACSDPNATITPLINRVIFNNNHGVPLRNSIGTSLSPFGAILIDPPLGIDKATYDALILAGLEKYWWNPTTHVIELRAV